MKLLVLAKFARHNDTVNGMLEGLTANGHTFEKMLTKGKEAGADRPDFAKRVIEKFHAGNFDTVFLRKCHLVPHGTIKAIAAEVDTTYFCQDSVGGNGCGDKGRPVEVGARGMLCKRVICTSADGVRWWRENGYKGRLAQIYQGCRHRIWRPADLDQPRKHPKQVCFLGLHKYDGDGGRKEKLAAMKKAGINIRWHPKRQYAEKAAKLYYHSGISLSLVCGRPREGPSPVGLTSNRLIRILTSGGFCLTERNTDVDASFVEGDQLAKFDFGDCAQLVDRIRYWLGRPKERLEIARRGWEWSEDWSWDQQMEKIVRFIEG